MKKTILILSLMALFLASFVYAQCTTDADCDDGVACTDDICYLDGSTCYNIPNHLECPGQLCDINQGCITKTCTTHEDCFDGLFCSGPEQCLDGYCAPHPPTPKNCDDGNPCTFDVCDEENDICMNLPIYEIHHCYDDIDNDCNGFVDLNDPVCLRIVVTGLDNRVSILEAWKTTVDSILASLQQQIDNIVNNFCDIVNACPPPPKDPCQEACNNLGFAQSQCRNSCDKAWSESAPEGDESCEPKVCCCK